MPREDAPARAPKCALPKCGRRAHGQETEYGVTLFCPAHRAQIPEDLRYRLAWARTESDRIERAAALRAIAEYLAE